MNTKYEIDIPETFAIDHAERSLPTGEEVKVLARTIRYRCTAPELREWLSDAEYYSDCAGQGWDMGPSALGLQASARGTVKRIAKMMIEHGVSRSGPIAN
tara:strand:+ start:130 stop:429 length:300 start_codon:yes stop_codon:yes gene_type:complete